MIDEGLHERLVVEGAIVTPENRVWFARGMYVGALVAAGERLVREVNPSEDERAALLSLFKSETEGEDHSAASWHAWREARIETAADELREVIARARAECFGLSG